MLYPIPQFEGYLIDKETAEVYTTFVTNLSSGNKRIALAEPKKLNGSIDRYKSVTLYVNGRRYTRFIHSLMLETFVSPRPSGMYALHNDGNRLNNKLENLRWGTPQENADDKVKHGNSLKGELNPKAKLSPKKVRVIRHAYDIGTSQTKLAEIFGVDQTQISRIVLRKAWTNV